MTTRRFVILPRDASNRVYGSQSLGLAKAEVSFLQQAVLGETSEVGEVELGGIRYLTVERSDRGLTELEVQLLSNVSATYALFELIDGQLAPITAQQRALCDDDILTIQRYSGKTNEQFTTLLVNVTLAAAAKGFEKLYGGDVVRLLDPACGRGTTLNQCIVYGIDACGIEIDKRDVTAYEQFLVKWMQDKRAKHHVDRATLRRGRPTAAQRFTVGYKWSKTDTRERAVDVFADDTLHAAQDFPKKSFDAVVCDLPYGVQHGSHGAAGQLSRSPEDLLRAALPGWADVLRTGGAIGLSWNLKTLPRQRVEDVLVGNGFELATFTDPTAFVHRVDHAIERDLIVATRSASR